MVSKPPSDVMKTMASSRCRSTVGEAKQDKISSAPLPGKHLKSAGRPHSTRRLRAPSKQGNIHLGHILVAVDFSAESEKAARYAASLAAEFGAAITLLHVVELIACQADY